MRYLLITGIGIYMSCIFCFSQLPDDEERIKDFHTYLANYPHISDSIGFINGLLSEYKTEKTFDLNVTSEISAFVRFKINGSDKDYFLVEYDYKDGAMAYYPWKYQFILDEEGGLVKILDAARFEFIEIFPQENPFLLVLEVTGKENGGHYLYKMVSGTLRNIYEGYEDLFISTYDSHMDTTVYTPYELILTIMDFDDDGFNDLSFSGNIFYHEEGITEPVEFVFLYCKETGTFKLRNEIVE